MKFLIRAAYVGGHINFFVRNIPFPKYNPPPQFIGVKKMEERTIWFIVDLIGELRKSGVRYEDMAADLYISERTIRNYAKGKIP